MGIGREDGDQRNEDLRTALDDLRGRPNVFRAILRAFRKRAPRAQHQADARRHHEQNGDLAERVKGEVGQQDAGDDVGRAQLPWNEPDLAFHQRPQRMLLAIADREAWEDQSE